MALLRNFNLSFLITLFFACCLFQACDHKQKVTFSGNNTAVREAEQMFEAIGGKNAWCDLKSLYIKAEHTEPQMGIPYQSEIWRCIDKFEMVIEQQNDSFHVKAIMNDEAGIIKYLDKRDTFRILSDEQLEKWKFDEKHNVYVVLHDLACDPTSYLVKKDKQGRLSFYQDTVFITSFGLDKINRPHLFYKPNIDGTISGSKFTHWSTDNGLTHSAGGHPLDSNFVYLTKSWIPSTKSLAETFGKKVFE